jgi:hypothetical protein
VLISHAGVDKDLGLFFMLPKIRRRVVFIFSGSGSSRIFFFGESCCLQIQEKVVQEEFIGEGSTFKTSVTLYQWTPLIPKDLKRLEMAYSNYLKTLRKVFGPKREKIKKQRKKFHEFTLHMIDQAKTKMAYKIY